MLYQYWNNLVTSKPLVDYLKNKKLSAESIMSYMMIRVNKMFKYENLPETIPQEILETFLIQNGTCYITKVKGQLYAFLGTMGGEPDPYYRPTKYIVANPALKLSEEYDLWKDGVLMRNDTLWLGLTPLMSRYAAMMAENILTIRTADIMLRAIAMITAPDDASRLSAELYLKKLQDGDLGVIGENPFFEGVKMQSPPSNNGSYLTQFIELHQYLKASFYNEIGLDANYNMKREAIMQGETMLNKDVLLPLCDNMLMCRKQDVEKVNELFGTNISVEFDSSWKQNQDEVNLLTSQLAGGSDEGSQESLEGTGENVAEESGSSSIVQSDKSESTDTNADKPDDDGKRIAVDADTGLGTGHQSGNAEAATGEDRIEEDSPAGAEGNIEITIINNSQLAGGDSNGDESDRGKSGDDSGDNEDTGNTESEGR